MMVRGNAFYRIFSKRQTSHLFAAAYLRPKVSRVTYPHVHVTIIQLRRQTRYVHPPGSYVTWVTGISPTLKVEVARKLVALGLATCYSGSDSSVPISVSLIKASCRVVPISRRSGVGYKASLKFALVMSRGRERERAHSRIYRF